MKIDYKKLQTLDLAVFSGKGLINIVNKASLIGWNKIFSTDVATHLGLVVEWKGQYFIAETSLGGLQLNSIEKYLHKSGRNWLIDIIRHPVYDDKQKREDAERRIAIDLQNEIKYDWKGFFGVFISLFGGRFVEDSDSYYCSEYCYRIMKPDVCDDFPDYFEIIVPPDDFYRLESFKSTGALLNE